MVNESLIKSRIRITNYQWRNRRRMAWTAFVSILIVTFLCFFVVDIDRLSKLETVVTWFYMAMASIVGAYMGFSTYASVAGNEMPSQSYSPYESDYEEPPQSSITPDNPDAPVRRRRVQKAPISYE